MKYFFIIEERDQLFFDNFRANINTKKYECITVNDHLRPEEENKILNKILNFEHKEDFCICLPGAFLKCKIDETANLFNAFLSDSCLNWDIILFDFKDERIWDSQRQLNFPSFFKKWSKMGDFISEKMLKKVINFPYALDKNDRRKPSFNYSNLNNKLILFNYKNILKIRSKINLDTKEYCILNILNNKLNIDLYIISPSISFTENFNLDPTFIYKPILEIVFPKRDEIIYSPEYLSKINIHESLVYSEEEKSELSKTLKVFFNGELKTNFNFSFNWKKNDYLVANNLTEINFNMYPELVYYFSKLKTFEKKEITLSISYYCPALKKEIKNKTKFTLQNNKEKLIKNQKNPLLEEIKAFEIDYTPD